MIKETHVCTQEGVGGMGFWGDFGLDGGEDEVCWEGVERRGVGRLSGGGE